MEKLKPFNLFTHLRYFKQKPFRTLCALLFISFALLTFLSRQSPVLGQTQATVAIDFGAPLQGIHSMSGFLYGIGDNKPPNDKLSPLQPKLWRTSTLKHYPRITGIGSQFQLLLSDTWGYGKPRGWPYEDYSKWEEHVRKLAQQHKGKNMTWDVWNEPDLKDPFWRGSRKQFFETYKRAYTAIRQELGPNVMIGGPSIAKYDQGFLRDFLDYCQENNLEVNFISWHELNDQEITRINNHVDEVRRSFVQNSKYQSLKIQKIYLNEIVGPIAQYRPAENLGYLTYAEQSRVDGACKACWEPIGGGRNNCFNESLDGLVTPEQSAPRAVWWVYKAYADGLSSRVKSESSNPRVVALASQSNPKGEAQILFGYFEQGASPGRATVVLTLRNLQKLDIARSGKPLTFAVARIPDSGEKVISQLETVKQDQISVGNQIVRLTIPNLKLHESYLLTIR
ncbi:beta-xylosidase [Lyngbya sp. PCC 8106]|uniref:GH39 family glycosyl hydrolase n=1 Tax=Lyngbya sp. (strain PCC 8106) TaxID=313612 RepID=UPI0005876C7E|nr:beta-xylosidase [Lyngbya sp. PCC 8106]